MAPFFACAVLHSPSGVQNRQVSLGLVSGDALDGIYEGVATFTPLQEGGTWRVSSFLIRDAVQNQIVLNDGGLTALGFPAYIELARSDIEVSPIVLDLGDVDVGLSAAQVVTVTNLGGADLVVTDIGFEGGVGSDFSISAAPALLATLLLDETADVEITFAPTALGAASAILQITSNDPDQGLVEVMLSGTGVVLDPSDALGTILVFFDQSVTDGTLVGSGPGGSGAMRLTALRNMLEAAGDLIDVGQAEIGVQPASRRLPTDGRSISATGFCGGHSGSRVGDANPRSPHIDGLRKNSYLKRIDAPLDAPKPSLKCWMELNEG